VFIRLAIAILVLITPTALQADPSPERIAVIINPSRQTSLSVDELAQVFLKQRRYWREGEPMLPVNREADSWQRELFTLLVFDQEVRQLEIYWNRQYYRGVLPPATFASDEAVKRFVAINRNAIGYIRESLVDDSIRVIRYLTRNRSDG
jgi:ABC-type phosphate transport system substrate-binding protein